MKIYVAGNSHLTHYTKIGAAFRGLHVSNTFSDADLILIAQDMTTDDKGNRQEGLIQSHVDLYCATTKPVILMSQVSPGFCRKQNKGNLYHYPETLRIKDSYERACNPEYIVIGCTDEYDVVNDKGGIRHMEVQEFAASYGCPHLVMTYEEAELCKIAVNTMLATQVEYANRMEAASKKIGADWKRITDALIFDKRIGPHAYLTPGRWQDSIHLLRDSVTLKEIENSAIGPLSRGTSSFVIEKLVDIDFL